jgi:dipeptidyl-peptidase-4
MRATKAGDELRWVVASLLALLSAGSAMAQAAAAPLSPREQLDEQIDRIFKDKAYEAPRFGPARWLPDGTAYAIVERSGPAGPGQAGPDAGAAGSSIVRYDAATGARTVLVEAASLTPPGAKEPLDIDDYAWSDDGTRLLIFTNTKKVWRRNTRGDYWVLGLADGGLRQVGREAPESSLMFAKFSPDGGRVAYVQANDLYVETLATGRVQRLTRDGSATIINGTTDWVYEEELDLRDAFRWSPDGRHLAYWQFDIRGVGVYSLINDTDTLYPTVRRYPYPKVGTANAKVRLGVVAATGGKTRWLSVPGDPDDRYLARLDWLDASTLTIQQLYRLQNRNDLLLADAKTGATHRVYRDESATWVDVNDEVRVIDGGRAFLWESEGDGWRHVYRIPRQGGAPTLLTRFDADITDVVGLDEAGGWLYVIASPDNATQRHLFRARLDGSGVPERVTSADQPGSHSYTLAPGGRLAFHTWSAFDRPPAMDVVELPSGRALRTLTDPSTLVAKLATTLQPPVELFRVDIGGGVTLDGWLLRPTTFDPARQYPAIVHLYGEPAGVTVVDRWGGNRMLFHRALAEAGYLVVSFDNRGTPSPRGTAWRKVVYGSVGDLSSREQAAAIRALAAARPYVDASRVGIWGASGGGTNTLNAMFRFPDVYRVGVAVAPVPDQQLYDTIYQERYMGLPKDNAEGYRVGSAINFAAGLAGNLLIVHGSGDDNVHYQGTERLVNRLVELGKPFDLMVYPNRTHALSEGPGTTPHLYHLIARYFLDHLPAGPAPPGGNQDVN